MFIQFDENNTIQISLQASSTLNRVRCTDDRTTRLRICNRHSCSSWSKRYLVIQGKYVLLKSKACINMTNQCVLYIYIYIFKAV